MNVLILGARQRRCPSAKGDGRPQEFNNYGVIKFKAVRSWRLFARRKVSCKGFSLATPHVGIVTRTHSISVGAAFFLFSARDRPVSAELRTPAAPPPRTLLRACQLPSLDNIALHVRALKV